MLITAACSKSELEWNQEAGYRWAEVPPFFWQSAGFEQLPASQTGIEFENRLADQSIVDNRNLLNGSGVAAADIDGDGLTDLYFAQLDGPNKLYKNLGGFRFRDITVQSGVSHRGYYSTGVVFSDIDGDGDQDLLIASMGKQNALYINNGNGKFELKENSGLGIGKGSMSMALADIDGDKDLDLYVTNYKEKSVKDIYGLMEITWENTVRRGQNGYRLIPPFDEHFTLIPGNDMPERRELGAKDELYINTGEGRFEKVSNPERRFLDQDGKELGLQQDWGLTAKFQDINGDMLPDLYVCNDFWTPDRVWINQGDGTFKAMNKLAIRNFSFSSMGVDFSDINRDGSLDFFVTEMLSLEHKKRLRQSATYSPFPDSIGQIENQPQYMRNTLYLNRGDNSFTEIARFSGVDASGWSWATRFLDVDLDGYEDLIINTGNAYDVQDLDTQERLRQIMVRNQREFEGYILEYPSLKLSNVIFQNNGDLTFSDKSSGWGFTEEDVSHGLATADFDNDGDLDLAINRLNQQAGIFENTSNAPRIAVRLKGNQPNTDAIGAKIKLEGGPVAQEKEIVAGRDYLSGSDPVTVFAADEVNNHTITIKWPDSSRSVIDSVKANRIFEIQQPQAGAERVVERSSKKIETIFEDVSARINHRHHEIVYDDFQNQPLLPVKLSRLGPGISWIDFDTDGDDDLLVASGKEGVPGVFENDGDGFFTDRTMGLLTEKTIADQTTILGWGESDKTKILVGNSNYENPSAEIASASNYSLSDDNIKNGEDDIPASRSSTGVLAAADYDGDRDVDLFVGGRNIPGNYPVDASSRLFKNESGHFRLDKENSKILNELGLVTAAVFTDYDRDGDQDLFCSIEWDTIKLFENENGRFRDITSSVGLDKYRGWWNGIATGDFNNDGFPDIIATNKGLNSSYRVQSEEFPLKIFYDDFDRDYQIEMVEAYYNPGISAYVPRRRFYDLHNSISSVINNVRSHAQYASSSLQDILATDLNTIPSKEINTLEHILFLNENGETFTARSLPKEAQFATAFSANIADFNNDGNEDLFLSQNFFAVPKLTSRQDAGRGLLLQGDGNGNLDPMSDRKSGIKVYGEQRGAALSDFNRDGKVDLAVTQNGAETKLYLNKTEKTGLQIKLIGPSENRDGIGSSIRLVYEDGSKGPRREIQAGSGYWSQNSFAQVLGTAGDPEAIEVTWFDGTEQSIEVSDANQSYEIHYPQ